MPEETRQRTLLAGPGPGPGIWDQLAASGEDANPMATVAHGLHEELLPVVNLTVGEVRRRFSDRLDLDPAGTALLDGRPVDDDTTIAAGQTLMFVRRAGEKGQRPTVTLFDALSSEPLTEPLTEPVTEPVTEAVTLVEDEVRVVSPEGQTASMKLADLLGRIASPWPGLAWAVLPDGVKCVHPSADRLIVVHQTPPRVFRFRWIAPDSPARHGPGTRYRDLRIALPYLIVVARFARQGPGLPVLDGWNECFFLNQPLDAKGVDSELCYPALLNCSRLPNGPERPLAWICTQYLGPVETPPDATLEHCLSASLKALLHHLLETGFNYSSEEHELSSWYSESVAADIDPRIASVEAWESASAEDPLFALEVPWLSTGRTLRQVVERAARAGGGRRSLASTARDVARLVLNGARKPRQRRTR